MERMAGGRVLWGILIIDPRLVYPRPVDQVDGNKTKQLESQITSMCVMLFDIDYFLFQLLQPLRGTLGMVFVPYVDRD